jgi:hypothetical protein
MLLTAMGAGLIGLGAYRAAGFTIIPMCIYHILSLFNPFAFTFTKATPPAPVDFLLLCCCRNAGVLKPCYEK